jgi:hypothetical protein
MPTNDMPSAARARNGRGLLSLSGQGHIARASPVDKAPHTAGSADHGCGSDAFEIDGYKDNAR